MFRGGVEGPEEGGGRGVTGGGRGADRDCMGGEELLFLGEGGGVRWETRGEVGNLSSEWADFEREKYLRGVLEFSAEMDNFWPRTVASFFNCKHSWRAD